jgi:cytochrome c553
VTRPFPNRRSLRRRILSAALVLAGGGVFAAVVAVIVILSGVFDVAATSKHSWPVAFVLHFTMQRSVAAHAPSLTPPDLDDPALILQGATHYATGCAPCHGGPGELASPIAQQMTPVPPGLYDVGRDFTPDELFWIVRHGVKMTAMPAWPAQQRDDEIWAMVAFLRHLPDQNTAAYARLTGIVGTPGFLDGDVARPASATPFDPAPCGRCHGADGMGRAGAFPRLAGLSEIYIANALRAFRDGSRPSGFMQPVAASLTDAQIAAAAKYFSALPEQTASATERQGEPPAGVQKCLSCHVRDAAQRQPAIPDLAGQPPGYLATQLHLLASGERPSPVRAAHQVPENQVAALVGYLSAPAATGPAPAAAK